MSDVPNVIWQTLSGLGGIGLIVQVGRSIYSARADRRSTDAGTGKTTTEAVTNLSGVAIQLLASAPAEIERLARRLREADEKIEALEAKIRDLNDRLQERARDAEALRAEMDQLNAQLTTARLELSRLRRDNKESL